MTDRTALTDRTAQSDRTAQPGRVEEGRAIRVALVHSLPAFRYGVAAALREQAGATVVLANSVDELSGRCTLALVSDRSERRHVAECVRRYPELPVIAVVAEPGDGIQQQLRALAEGAITVVTEHDALEEIAAVVAAACRGYARIPVQIVRALADGRGAHRDEPGLELLHVDLLRDLSRGSSVSNLARVRGYSERELYRRLAVLYSQLGVSNRSEALVLAAKRGLV
jgi:DNA-binding NarL/FixJ family response regulator